MITMEDRPTTYIPIFPTNADAFKPFFNIASLAGGIYIEMNSFFQTITQAPDTIYINQKEDLAYTNHIELIGEAAREFENTVLSIKEPNDLMVQLIKEVYEDRIFE